MGLPRVKNYYKVFKTLDIAVDQNYEKNSEMVAQLKVLQETNTLPVTNHLVSYKGSEDKV